MELDSIVSNSILDDYFDEDEDADLLEIVKNYIKEMNITLEGSRDQTNSITTTLINAIKTATANYSSALINESSNLDSLLDSLLEAIDGAFSEISSDNVLTTSIYGNLWYYLLDNTLDEITTIDGDYSFIRQKRASILLTQALIYPVIGYHSLTLGQNDFFSTFTEIDYFFKEFLYEYCNTSSSSSNEEDDGCTYKEAISKLESLTSTSTSTNKTFPELTNLYLTIVKALFSCENPYSFSMNRDVSEAFSLLAYQGSKLYVFNDYRDSLITAALNERFNYLNAGILEDIIELYAKELIKHTRYNIESLQDEISSELSENAEALSEDLTNYRLAYADLIPTVLSSFGEYISTLLSVINNWFDEEYETTALENLIYFKETYQSILESLLSYSGNIDAEVISLYEATYMIGIFVENPYGKSNFTYSTNLQKLEMKVVGAYKCGSIFQNLYVNFIDSFTEYLEEKQSTSKFVYETLFEKYVDETESTGE